MSYELDRVSDSIVSHSFLLESAGMESDLQFPAAKCAKECVTGDTCLLDMLSQKPYKVKNLQLVGKLSVPIVVTVPPGEGEP